LRKTYSLSSHPKNLVEIFSFVSPVRASEVTSHFHTYERGANRGHANEGLMRQPDYRHLPSARRALWPVLCRYSVLGTQRLALHNELLPWRLRGTRCHRPASLASTYNRHASCNHSSYSLVAACHVFCAVPSHSCYCNLIHPPTWPRKLSPQPSLKRHGVRSGVHTFS